MGRQIRVILWLWFLVSVVTATGNVYAQSGQAVVPFQLPPIPSKQDRVIPEYLLDPAQREFEQADDIATPFPNSNIQDLQVKTVSINTLNPDIVFVPIDQAIARARRNFNGVVLVAKGSQIIFEHSYDPSKKKQDYSDDDVNRQFLLGSMTKQFTATLILKLVDRKIISLEDSIQKFFPDTPKSWENIKVKNLLNHTSGFTYEYLSYKHSCPFQTEAHGLALLKSKNPSYLPGEGFHYVNMNYFLLGAIAMQVTGQELPDLIQSEITDPLSMDLSGMLGPSGGNGFNPTQPGCHFAVGNMYSSARDLFKWENALFNDRSVLSEETLKRMLYPEVSTHHYYYSIEKERNKKVYISVPSSYGLGIHFSEIDGKIIYWHSGHITNYTALVEYYPKDKVTIVVLSHTTNDKVFNIATEVTKAVLDLPTIPAPVNRSKVIKTAAKPKRRPIKTHKYS